MIRQTHPDTLYVDCVQECLPQGGVTVEGFMQYLKYHAVVHDMKVVVSKYWSADINQDLKLADVVTIVTNV